MEMITAKRLDKTIQKTASMHDNSVTFKDSFEKKKNKANVVRP